jgi:hypothetical protein
MDWLFILVSFVIAMVFSPWGEDFFSYIYFLVCYEILVGIFLNPTLSERFWIVVASLFGWVYGRCMMGFDDLLFGFTKE